MIELTNVTKNFGLQKVIKDISLSIHKGEVIGLLGPNGAGKTTTVRMIAGVLPPSAGKVRVDNSDLFAQENINNPHIGYLPENNPIYDDMTVEEFINMWAELKHIPKEKQEALVEKAVVDAGLEDVYFRPISELSKGYRQRTGLAQAILSQPDILLLDEPTEGLDPNQRHDIHNLIKGMGKERTVIICSHVLPEITKMCDRVIIINNGKIVADSPTRNLESLEGGKIVYKIVASGKTIEKDLAKLPKIVSVSKSENETANLFTITSESKKDLRLDIFKLAKTKNWKLYELARKQQDLEDIFARLTK